VPSGEEAYGRSCLALHDRLGLRERFLFRGPTGDPDAAIRSADVVLMTSISEGLPMSILEAMGQGRPVVATGVGGVPDVVRGCGAVCAPGDDHALAMAVVLLLRNPELAARLGQRGHRRLKRIYTESACIDGYRDLLQAVAEPVVAPPARIGLAA
jgi:glycosyltransferase involved in cell wall biosynthesis